jgi:hypothetical protein
MNRAERLLETARRQIAAYLRTTPPESHPMAHIDDQAIARLRQPITIDVAAALIERLRASDDDVMINQICDLITSAPGWSGLLYDGVPDCRGIIRLRERLWSFGHRPMESG